MNKFDRITAILIHLQSKRLVTAQELSDRFEVSLRTIYRDIESLSNAGVPVLGEIGVGYSMMEGYRLPPVMFTQEEAIAFLMAEKIIDKYADTENNRHFQSALFKVKSVLRSGEKNTVEDIENRISVIKSSEKSIVVDKTLPLVLRSVTEKSILQITYTVLDASNSKTILIEPIGIYNENGIWSTIAFNHDTGSYRHFRIDRISQVKYTGKPFSKEHLSLRDYFESLKKEETVFRPVISINKEIAHYIEEQKHKYGFTSQQEKGNEIEMTFETTCLQTFSRWFLTIADNAKILETNELKALLKEIVANISKNL
jgi:predicted DNA-binding transcriptional regulator YafY